MLPRLTKIPQLSPLVSDYLDALRLQHFEGDIASNYADRLSLARAKNGSLGPAGIPDRR